MPPPEKIQFPPEDFTEYSPEALTPTPQETRNLVSQTSNTQKIQEHADKELVKIRKNSISPQDDSGSKTPSYSSSPDKDCHYTDHGEVEPNSSGDGDEDYYIEDCPELDLTTDLDCKIFWEQAFASFLQRNFGLQFTEPGGIWRIRRITAEICRICQIFPATLKIKLNCYCSSENSPIRRSSLITLGNTDRPAGKSDTQESLGEQNLDNKELSYAPLDDEHLCEKSERSIDRSDSIGGRGGDAGVGGVAEDRAVLENQEIVRIYNDSLADEEGVSLGGPGKL